MGKTVYLRDNYNYVNIKEAYGTFDGDDAGVAKINWDSVEQSNDNNNGSNENSPVSTLKKAEEIIGTNGGKIVIVNHYTFEAGKESDSVTAYAYENGFENKSLTIYEEIGNNVKNGVLTITGENQGKLNEDVLTINGVVQSKNASEHTDASIYLKNTRGNQKYNGSLYEPLT